MDRARWNGRRHYTDAPLKHDRAGHPDPAPHIPAGVVVGVPSIPAARASETLPLTVSDGPAAATTLARVRGGHFLDGHARQRRLVHDLRFEVEIGPVVAVLVGLALGARALLGGLPDAA